VAPRFVFLVGFMGAGKTTVGGRLAELLGRPFVDLDARIEAEAGIPVARIFEQEGEAGFRARERRALAGVLEEGRSAAPPPVVAVGGGAFAEEGNRRAMLESGLCVWLEAPLEVLRRRAGGERPLWRDAGEAELLLHAREPAYAEAHLRVRSDAGGAAELAVELSERVRRWEGESREAPGGRAAGPPREGPRGRERRARTRGRGGRP